MIMLPSITNSKNTIYYWLFTKYFKNVDYRGLIFDIKV